MRLFPQKKNQERKKRGETSRLAAENPYEEAGFCSKSTEGKPALVLLLPERITIGKKNGDSVYLSSKGKRESIAGRKRKV